MKHWQSTQGHRRKQEMELFENWWMSCLSFLLLKWTNTKKARFFSEMNTYPVGSWWLREASLPCPRRPQKAQLQMFAKQKKTSFLNFNFLPLSRFQIGVFTCRKKKSRMGKNPFPIATLCHLLIGMFIHKTLLFVAHVLSFACFLLSCMIT